VLGNSLLKKACLLGHEKSCINISNSDFIYKLGKRFQKGIGVKKNIALSNKLLARGCELGSQYSCYSLALSLNDENPKGANKYYRRGCILNHAASCYFIAHDYEVNKSNNESAKKFYKKACSLGDKISCNHKIGAKGAGVCNFSETNQANNTLFFIFIVLFTFTLRKKILKAK